MRLKRTGTAQHRAPAREIRLTSALVTPRTYVYTRPDGVRCHVNAAGPIIGTEYEHADDLHWTPPTDWPYEWTDQDNQ